VTVDGCDAVEGVASMGIAMRYTEPVQVRLADDSKYAQIHG